MRLVERYDARSMVVWVQEQQLKDRTVTDLDEGCQLKICLLQRLRRQESMYGRPVQRLGVFPSKTLRKCTHHRESQRLRVLGF